MIRGVPPHLAILPTSLPRVTVAAKERLDELVIESGLDRRVVLDLAIRTANIGALQEQYAKDIEDIEKWPG